MSLTKLAGDSRDHHSFTVAVSIQHDVNRTYKQTTIVSSPDILAMPIEWRQHYFSIFPTYESLFTKNRALAKAPIKGNLFQNIWIDVLHEFLRDDLFGRIQDKASAEGVTRNNRRLRIILTTVYETLLSYLLEQENEYTGYNFPRILFFECAGENISSSWLQPIRTEIYSLPSPCSATDGRITGDISNKTEKKISKKAERK